MQFWYKIAPAVLLTLEPLRRRARTTTRWRTPSGR